MNCHDRQRHLKCDETQPSCLRCLRINEVCPGSRQSRARIFGLATVEGFESDFERSCFDSFFTAGWARVADYQPSTKSFWSTILPQLCQLYLPLRHGAIVLAYISEPFYNPVIGPIARSRPISESIGVILSHFNQSLRGFVEDMDRLSIEAKVSCCILYTALTLFMYRVAGAPNHVTAAVRFLRQYEDSKGRIGSALRDVLTPCIRRLVLDACTFSGDMSAFQRGEFSPLEEYMSEVLQVPRTLDTFEDAYELLGNMLKYAINLSIGDIRQDSQVAVHLQTTLKEFEIVLTNSKIEKRGGRELSQQMINFHRKDLLLHLHVTRLMSFFTPGMLEDSYSRFFAEFRVIVDKLTDLIEDEPDEPWRVTLCWLPPLFLVATKCRDYALRSQALHMLHRLSRAERGWTSCIAYSLAKFVIDLEGSSSPHEAGVPAVAQYAHLLSVSFVPDRHVVDIRYLLQRDRRNLGVYLARLPTKPISKTIIGAPAINVPVRMLQAFGYNGQNMLSPQVECHCYEIYKSPRVLDKVIDPINHKDVIGEANQPLIRLKDNRWYQLIAGTKTTRQ